MQSVPCFCPILTKFGLSQQFLVKVVSIKFHGNPSSGNLANTFGRTDMTTQIGAFRNYAKAPEKVTVSVLGGDRGSTVVKVLCYKSEGRRFDPSLCLWNFSLT